MHRHAELKRFTNPGRFHTRPNAAPERRIQQHHIDCRIQNIRGELLEVNHDGVCREWHANLLTHTPHSIHAKHRIFEIIIAYVFDLLSEPDRSLGGPDAVWIEAKAISGKCGSKCTIA